MVWITDDRSPHVLQGSQQRLSQLNLESNRCGAAEGEAHNLLRVNDLGVYGVNARRWKTACF
jgi:hypothetical protein